MQPNSRQILDIVPPLKHPFIPPVIPSKKKEKPLFKFVVLAVILYAATLLVIDFFSEAEIRLVLRSEVVEVNSLLSAGASDAEILLEKVVFEDRLEASAETQTFKDFSERASGQIIIYNAYSSEPQTLVADTRFETPDGKTYRITKSLIVPGAKVVDGRIEHSSMEITVFASSPGEEYNIGLDDFTIPGFKGSVKYDKFYARSKTPMSGGFVGRAKIVGEKDIETLRKSMEEALKQKLYYKMRADIPEGFLVPEGVYKHEIKIDSVEPAKGSRADKFKMTLAGVWQAFFIRKADIKKQITERFKDDPNLTDIDIANLDELKVAATETDFESLKLKFKVAGAARAVWNIEARVLAKELAAAFSTAERLAVFEKYPQIIRAEIVYKPFWWRVFPEDADKAIIKSSY